MLDRIDIHIDVPAVKVEKLHSYDPKTTESSFTIRKRVQKARDMQTKRFIKSKITSNSEMGNKEIKEFCRLDENCIKLLRLAVLKMGLSARSYNRTIKLARTIADLEEKREINSIHIAEALQYRPRNDNI
jgi:magnesium chelatase family protein